MATMATFGAGQGAGGGGGEGGPGGGGGGGEDWPVLSKREAMVEWTRLRDKAWRGSDDEDWRRLQRHMQHYGIGGYDVYAGFAAIVWLMWRAPVWLAEWARSSGRCGLRTRRS